MNEPHRNDCRANRPATGSVYEFHVACWEISACEVVPPLGTPPKKITPNMPPDQAKFWRRWNPFLEIVEADLRKEAIAKLTAAGMPAARFEEPWCPQIQEMVTDYIRGEQCSLLLRSEYRRRQTNLVNPRALKAHHQVLISAHLCRGGSQKAADFLNGGVPRGSGEGICRDHVYRAFRKYLDLPGRDHLIVHAELTQFVSHFHTLEIIRREAGGRPEYRTLRGRELAEAIHDRQDLYEVMHRASAKLSPRILPKFRSETRASAA